MTPDTQALHTAALRRAPVLYVTRRGTALPAVDKAAARAAFEARRVSLKTIPYKQDKSAAGVVPT